MALLIKTDGTAQQVNPENGSYFALEELYKILDCRVIEKIDLHDGRMMICDEESKLADDWQKNKEATMLFKQGRMSKKQMQDYFKKLEKEGTQIINVVDLVDPSDCIAGDVIICNQIEFI